LVIENSIQTAQKLIKSKPYKKWPEEVLEDFRVIDLELIKSIF
ncbi:MAG TPA: GrdX protein, partial [Clostridiaceae bacterium]|nr:GrdX protein [Clostridiaceae bacterium]